MTLVVIRNSADTLGVVPGMSLAQLQQLCSKAKSAFGGSVPAWDTASVRTSGVALGSRQLINCFSDDTVKNWLDWFFNLLLPFILILSGGCDASDLSSLSNDAINVLKPDAIKHFPGSQLAVSYAKNTVDLFMTNNVV